ncbi:HAMP domain-containing protein [Oculatella sp. LEGE 06141]|nr:ATP-binding protein [Oculatella sp. LEGE 06141]MBE9179750.1 HAMP domain-containing protein [Oculatella sp. LEGE 06141]
MKWRDRAWWNRAMGEARTRILLLYVVLMLFFTAVSIPIFRFLLFTSVDSRVRDDLRREMDEFRTYYQRWEQEPNQSVNSLKQFVADFLANELPEDDNFLIVLIEGEFYQSNPTVLPAQLQPNSPLVQRWKQAGELSISTAVKQELADPNMGDVIYLLEPLELDGVVRGTFVVAHITLGERQEALAAVLVFTRVALGVVVISFVLAWAATGQVLSPVRSLSTTARSISESDLNRRIPVQGNGEMAELAETFNAMMNRIQSAFNSQRNFINDAGHELRTPITIIRGHLELLGNDPQEQQETLEIVLDELDRMSRFVNDMILLAKAERPDFLQLETINVPSFTKELFAKAQALAERNWKLTIEGTGRIVGDRQRITGALINLAQNATQYTQCEDVIELGAALTRSNVKFWVRDTGEGIAPADQERIFERFARAANSYRRSEGAGLGLSIVRAVAEAHGGRIDLVSQPGMGSTFTVVLPLEPPQEKLSG